MKPRALIVTPVLLLAPLAATVHAGITLSADLTFAEQGGTIGAGNLGTSGTAFAKDLIAGGAFAPTHTIPNVNNGTFGNASSWIGDSAPSYVGVGFASIQNIASFAFGRDNTGAFGDRAAGSYTIEYTNDPNPVTNHATATWTNLGTVGLSDGQGVFSGLRHRFNINTPVAATGFRLVTFGGAAVDELEIFSSAGAIVPLPPGLVTSAASGFSIAWDGNDGDNFNLSVPNNLALSVNGGTAFASGALAGGTTNHQISNLNDGFYGNTESWIGDNGPAPLQAGVMLGAIHEITSIAFGRDNGGDPGDCCGGQLRDRALGTYTLQRTLDGTSWETLGTITYNFDEDDVAGGGFTPHLRHEFELSDGNGGITALGLRLLTPNAGIAIDEIEIFGTVPEPASAGLLTLVAALFMRRRRA